MAKKIKYHSMAAMLLAIGIIDTHVFNFAGSPSLAFLNPVANRIRQTMPIISKPVPAAAALVLVMLGSKMVSKESPHFGSKTLGHGLRV